MYMNENCHFVPYVESNYHSSHIMSTKLMAEIDVREDGIELADLLSQGVLSLNLNRNNKKSVMLETEQDEDAIKSILADFQNNVNLAIEDQSQDLVPIEPIFSFSVFQEMPICSSHENSNMNQASQEYLAGSSFFVESPSSSSNCSVDDETNPNKPKTKLSKIKKRGCSDKKSINCAAARRYREKIKEKMFILECEVIRIQSLNYSARL